jgi:hypothetical protein
MTSTLCREVCLQHLDGNGTERLYSSTIVLQISVGLGEPPRVAFASDQLNNRAQAQSAYDEKETWPVSGNDYY